MKDLENIKCPNCGAQKFLAEKRGFHTGNFLAWSLIKNTTWGFVAGSLGANEVIVTCLNCKQQYKVEEDSKAGCQTIGCMLVVWIAVVVITIASLYKWVIGLFS